MSAFKESVLLLAGLGLLAFYCFRASSAVSREVSDSFWRKTDYPILAFAGLVGWGFLLGYSMRKWHRLGQPTVLLFAAGAITIAAIGVGVGRVIERGAEEGRSNRRDSAEVQAREGETRN